MDFKLKSHKSSTALQDCGAVFGGIKIILPRQAGVVPAMIRGCLEGIRAFLPWRSVSAWPLSLNCCWSLRCLELSSIYHRFQRFPLLIFKVFTKTLCLPHEEELPHRHTDLQAFSHVAKCRRGSQLLIYLSPISGHPNTCGFYFFRCHGIFCFFIVSQHYHLYRSYQAFWVNLFPKIKKNSRKLKPKQHKWGTCITLNRGEFRILSLAASYT